MTDSPFSDAKAVLITFSAVSVHRTGGGFTTLPFAGAAQSRTCDLKKLEGADDILGTVNLPAGEYTQVRLTVTAATLHFDNPSVGTPCAPAIVAPAGSSAAVTVPSGVLRLNRPFELEAETVSTMLLDFDGDASIHQTGAGSYIMEPVISVVSVQ